MTDGAEELQHHGRMPSTHWSMVRRAGVEDAAMRREALGELLQRYTPALRWFLVTVRREKPQDADDLLQGFVTDKMVEGEIFRHADAGKGRFRSFLLTSLVRYCFSQHRRAVTLKRGGGNVVAVEEIDAADNRLDPPAAFDAAWARALVAKVLSDMQKACADRPDLWAVFAARVLPEMRGEDAMTYDEMVRRFGLRNPSQASNLLISAKRLYARLLRQRVGEYEEGEHAIDDEIRSLRAALAAAGGNGGRP